MDAQFVVDKWKKFVKKNQELREMLLVQYRGTFIKILYTYREFKKRQFQNYIINNASKLIIRTMKYHHFKQQNFNTILSKFKVKRFYIHKSQQQLFQEITQIKCQQTNLQVLRFDLQKQSNYQLLLINTLKEPKNAIVIGNFHQMKLQYSETDQKQQVINYPFLYEFQNQVTVKTLQKSYKFSANERFKYYQTLQKINKNQFEKYQQLCVVELTAQGQKAFQLIQKYNKSNNEAINIIVDYQLNRIIAACKIQKFFRAKLDVNQNGMTLDQIMRLINQSRSIFVIQQWFRRMRQLHRIIFFKEIAYQAHIICSNILYLDFETYENIENIINNQQFSLKFLEQYCAIVMDENVVRLQLHIPKTDFFGQQTYLQQIQELRKYQNQNQLKVIPTWLLKQLQIVPIENKISIGMDVLKQEESVRFQRKNRTQLKKVKQSLAALQPLHKYGDIYNLLHVGASIEFEAINNRKYIKFTYSSISEARYRAISIALLTYKFKQNGTYIWMISENIWEDLLYSKKSYLEQYYQKIQKIYKIEFNQQSSDISLQKQNKPIILCQNLGEVKQFGNSYQSIDLSFYDEIKKVDQKFYYVLNEEELTRKKIIQCTNQVNSTVHSPLKFSIYQLDPPQMQDKKKLYTFDTSVYILSSKYKSMQKPSPRQTYRVDIAKKQEISYENMTERISKYRYQNKTTKLKIDDCMKNINESYITDRRSIVSNLKSNTKRSEKTFESDFIMLTALVQRQERNVVDKIKNKQKNEAHSIQNRSQDRSQDRSYSQKISSQIKTPSLNPNKKIDRGTSFDEDSDRSRLVFPSINQKKQNRQTQKQRLSDYHRYAIFSEELYAIHNNNNNSNQDSIKY